MGRSRRTNKLHIHLENEHLIMHGSPHESAGCVLRGVLNLTLKKPTRVKSMMMRFTGKMSISWNEPVGKGHERMVKEEKIIMHHHWWFLPMQAQMYRLGAGSHPFEFELPLPGNLPESTQVANLYLVDYQLKAVVQRPTFLPDYVSKRTLHLSRQMLPLTPDFMEPVSLQNQWVGKIDYEIMMPTKIYTRGEDIPLTIRMTPCVNNLKIRFVACTFKEYMTCRAAHGLFGGKTRSHNRILRYVRDDNLNHTCRRGVPWSTILQVPVPRLPDEVHCDVQTDVVRIRHKLKFVLSIENTDGHLSELRAVLPVTICAMKLAGLPAYEETWQSMPYEPALMMALLSQPDGLGSHSMNLALRRITLIEDSPEETCERRSSAIRNSLYSMASSFTCHSNTSHLLALPFQNGTRPSSRPVSRFLTSSFPESSNESLPTYDELLAIST